MESAEVIIHNFAATMGGVKTREPDTFAADSSRIKLREERRSRRAEKRRGGERTRREK